MKSFDLQFQFDDEFYQELSELASNLDISTSQLISQFFEEGVALTWDAFEHKAKQKRENDQ